MMSKIKILLILFLFPLLVSGQVLKDGANDIVASPYEYFPNDVAEWTVSSGSFANGGGDNRTYIECTSNGVAYFESTQAYGEWRFDVYKGNTANLSRVFFLSDSYNIGSENGYQFQLRDDESIRFRRMTSGGGSNGFDSYVSYISNSTWYTIRIIRESNGKFTVYIKGGIYNTWTLVDASITGTNPITDNTHTTSNYLIIDFDNGDKISNIRFQDIGNSYTILKQ